MKGMLVHVLRCAVADCTNGGLTSKYDSFILIGPGIPEHFEPTKDTPALFVEDRARFGYRAVPDSSPEQFHKRGPMFGGNFVYSSDSRFPGKAPIAVHDRFESNY